MSLAVRGPVYHGLGLMACKWISLGGRYGSPYSLGKKAHIRAECTARKNNCPSSSATIFLAMSAGNFRVA